MVTPEESFKKILHIISPILLAVNQGKYANVDYRMIAIKPFLNELRAEIEPQKSSLQYGIIKLFYHERENRIDIFTTSIAAWKFARILGEALIKERVKYISVLHLAPRQKGEG